MAHTAHCTVHWRSVFLFEKNAKSHVDSWSSHQKKTMPTLKAKSKTSKAPPYPLRSQKNNGIKQIAKDTIPDPPSSPPPKFTPEGIRIFEEQAQVSKHAIDSIADLIACTVYISQLSSHSKRKNEKTSFDQSATKS